MGLQVFYAQPVILKPELPMTGIDTRRQTVSCRIGTIQGNLTGKPYYHYHGVRTE